MAARGESPQHLALKQAAIGWALENGYTIAAAEIRIPRSAYRADVVAVTTTIKGGPKITRSAIFECKQSRSDLIKDSRSVKKTLDRIAELTARKHTLDTLLGVHYPSLRTSDELFSDFTVPTRVRYFSDGVAIGGREFVESVFLACRERFGKRRKEGARRMRGGPEGMFVLRDLRRAGHLAK